ncbi:uncharacterized protein TRIVIDRAFT_227886 [Trichoderma virens Gv29-8]|uniref:Killer toxin Kp4 domain-containing protein n=1 Tax=Hypocrea virens (strain Gv29-8 / FGSC 10586) TaxID=413071 RepID=G9NAU0_HYPVG|nr:uncharacterized protein TRIVIDRAFT_227886 [Trichoderma virens Gv29-8]EHK15951.1 hypothetical protein TRIVIDRAFT_227886 [Trichoderma virens Gv29-8]UKZ56276.1 hypothetical protein TrVGV298_010110 [Trichoderma virens]
MHLNNIFSTLATTASAVNAMGINCQGSALCVGSNGELSSALDQLRGMDQNQQFTDGQHITCVGSPVSLGNPSLCLFYQKTGRSWTVAQTVRFVQALLDHGCEGCGSIPVDSGNNVQNGMLTANMVAAMGGPPPSRRGMDIVRAVSQKEKPADENAAIKKRGTTTTPSLAKRLGINCQGSSTCQVGGIFNTPAGTLDDLGNSIAGGPDGLWGDGQQIGCIAHVTGRLCAFYQNRVCGSVPTNDGNNVVNGQLTVNYVA